MTAPATIPQAFRRLLQRARPDGDCLLIGTTPRYRYVRANGRIEGAHRVSYIATYGGLPEDEPHVLHSCHRRNCIAPIHVHSGDQILNSREMVAADRSLRGERHPRSRVTAPTVRRIRERVANGETHAAIARELGISRSTISAMISGRNWGYLR
jgi:hypothetical protein